MDPLGLSWTSFSLISVFYAFFFFSVEGAYVCVSVCLHVCLLLQSDDHIQSCDLVFAANYNSLTTHLLKCLL